MSLRIPPAATTIHLIGDTHISYFFTPVKQSILLRDMAKPSVPKVAYTFQVGDHTNEQPGEDAAALAFYEELRTQFGTQVYVTYGNHDIRSTVASPTMGPNRTIADFVALYGLPAASYTVDIGPAIVIMLGIDSEFTIYAPSPRIGYDAATLAWLTAQLDASTKPAIIVTHPALKDTVGVGDAGEIASNQGYWYADPDTTIRNIIANHGEVIAWVSGHVHANLTSPNFVKTLTIGTKTVAAIATSSLGYTGRDPQWWDSMPSVYVTLYDTSIEVRFRDHGAGQWASANVDGALQKVATIIR
jgi:hypothetical protein